MKNTIKKLTKLVALSAYLVAYGPAFAAPCQANETQQGGFFDINEEFPLHFGVKSFGKIPFRHMKDDGYKDQTIGLEYGVGPFIEWKPLNGIGVQVGAQYTFNRLFGFTKGLLMKPSFFDKVPPLEKSGAKFHTFSIPFSIRLYPGDSKEFALYGGIRVIMPLGKAKVRDYDIGSFLFGSDQAYYELKATTQFAWDFGFDCTSESGLIVGMSGLGIQVGYDFSKLLVQP